MTLVKLQSGACGVAHLDSEKKCVVNTVDNILVKILQQVHYYNRPQDHTLERARCCSKKLKSLGVYPGFATATANGK